jgi:hypothetical protein
MAKSDSPKVGFDRSKHLDRSKTGRAKGTPNKTTVLLKDAILKAAELAGEDIEKEGGLVAYLKQQAQENPGPFLALVGKVLPLQIQAQVNHKATITDAELEAIARTSRSGASEETEGPRFLN